MEDFSLYYTAIHQSVSLMECLQNKVSMVGSSCLYSYLDSICYDSYNYLGFCQFLLVCQSHFYSNITPIIYNMAFYMSYAKPDVHLLLNFIILFGERIAEISPARHKINCLSNQIGVFMKSGYGVFLFRQSFCCYFSQ